MGYICITLLFLALVLPGNLYPQVPLSLLCAVAWFILMILAKAGIFTAP